MVDTVNELDGKVVVVTGSVRKIGRATAEELAKAGAVVVVNGRSSKELGEEVANGIVKSGGKAITIQADISDPDAVTKMMNQTALEFGGIDILVNNASWRNIMPIEEMDLETFKRAQSVQLDGAFKSWRAMISYMIPRGEGNIIGIGGVGSTKGMPGRAHAEAVKNAMHALIRSMALDLAKYQMHCNVCVVGNFDTTREGSSSVALSHLENDPIPLCRHGHPQGLANLVRFAVGPNASHITGQTLHCNGGLYMAL
ncbi:SDR family oxidoreductase [Alphaproteobacteria bacterium]|jgi:3-oxoacyl-[acyl-carrier protein] reductase|nr:SDR family oxidoreductase [Alphaproteobacteria bacterium]